MALPYPQITFRVKTYDATSLNGQLLPDSRDNIISQLESATVWILNWPYPLKHNDTFTLYGKEAIETQKNYSQLGTANAYLETVYYGIPLIPTPTPTASPAPSATPSPTPSATPEPTPNPTGTPGPTATAAPTPTVTPEPTPSGTPEPTPTGTPEPTPSATPEPTPSATPI